MYEFFPMGLFLLGLLGGLPVSAVVVRLPYAVERQWLLDASETLGIARNPDGPGQLGLAWRPDHFSLRVGLTMLAMGLLAGWVGLHYGVGPAALAAVVLVAGLLALSLIDLEHQLLPDVLLMSTLAATVVFGVGMVSGKIDRKSPQPFGPFLAGAGWLALMYTPDWTAI